MAELKDQIEKAAYDLSIYGYVMCGSSDQVFQGTPDEYCKLLELALWQVELGHTEPNESGFYNIFLKRRRIT